MNASQIQQFCAKNKPQFLKYKKYLIANDWTASTNDGYIDDSYINDMFSGDLNKVKKAEIKKLMAEQVARQKSNTQYKSEEFKLQNELVKNMLDRIKYLVKKTGNHSDKNFKSFIKLSLGIVKIHSDRVDTYVNSVDISKIENQEVKSEEIKLMKECFAGISKINDDIESLNIKEDASEANGIEFLDGIKAPLSMHWILSEIYPEINLKLKAIGVDPEAEPDNKFHIHNENPPKWDTSLHYFQQEKSVLSYYFREFKKLREGILIDGYYISGWMYYHINVFMTPIPQKVFNQKSGLYESKDKIMHPPLRDSDVIIFETHERQKRENILFMFIAATRRAAKTTLEASKLSHAATIGKKELLCAGGSAKDLGQLSKNFKIDIQYKDPAFAVYNVTNDWKSKIELGIKTKGNKTILLSTLNVINTDGGNNTEVLAGFTPDEFLYDEAMKSKFREALQGLKPALKGTEGLIRCFGILSGTGGDEAMSEDGYITLNDPEQNSVVPMDWDLLERGVPEDCKTWQEDRNKPFGTFIPGQMCVDMPKFDGTLADYIGKPESEELKKIKLKLTDWEKSTKQIQDARDKVIGDKVAYNKEVIYTPVTPGDIFRSGKISPWPVAEAKAHKDYLLRTGKWDRRREIYKDLTGKICLTLTTKELAPFPHKGGIINAPLLIFEDPPEEKPKYGTYTGGFDDYMTDDSTTTSVSTFYVMKNKILGDPFSEKIVASISFRPERHQEVYEKWLLLCEAYGLETTVFGENFNYAYKDFLDRKHLADVYLAPSLDFSIAFNISNNLRRKTGWDPRTTKKHVHDAAVEYCNEPFDFEDENGNIITVKGVQRIDDIGLLDEIIGWGENVNTDRLTGFYGAVAYMRYLQSSQRWRVKEMQRENKDVKPKNTKARNKSFYGGTNRQRNFYRNR